MVGVERGFAVAVVVLLERLVGVALPHGEAMTPLDLAAVRCQIAESIPWRDGVLTVEQAEALVAEVERLRANAEARERFLRREGNSLRAAQRARDDLRGKLDRLNDILINSADLAGKAERADVVAWLREEAEAAAQTYTEQAGEWAKRIDDMADAIERGVHRRTGGSA